MTDTQILIDEYGILPPSPDDYDSGEAYQAAFDAWFDGFAAFVIRKTEEEEAARLAEEEARRQAEEEEAARQAREEEEEAARQAREEEEEKASPVIQEPETEDRYPVGSYVDPDGKVWAASGELLSTDAEDSNFSGVYVDSAGNLWSETGELLSPGTTPAVEPVQELAGEVTGEPVIDTAILLWDLINALTGEDGMTSDVDGIQQTVGEIQQTVNGIQQALDHPLMTTSFQDYNVTEGLLLLLLLSVFVAACAKMLKEGFSWLR